MSAPKPSVAILLDHPECPERVTATPLFEDVYLITDIPRFSPEVGFLDMVRARPRGAEGLVIKEVVTSSSWSTFAILLRSRDTTMMARSFRELESLGCKIQGWNEAYFSIALPNDAAAYAASYRLLDAGDTNEVWRAGPVLVRDQMSEVAA